MNMIRRIEPLVTYGYLNRSMISQLIYKRGYGKVNRDRVPLNDNSIIEQQLGKYGIVCVEDLINEIANAGPHFKQANNFLWPFKLNSPRKGMELKRRPYQNGGAHGNREEFLGDFIKKII